MNSLSNRDEFPNNFANLLWIHYLFTQNYNKFTVYFVNLVRIHMIFSEFTINSVDIQRIYSEFTIFCANSQWTRFVIREYALNPLIIHLVFRKFAMNLLVVSLFTMNLLSLSRIDHVFTLYREFTLHSFSVWGKYYIFTIYFANPLRISFLFRFFTMNKLSRENTMNSLSIWP